MLPNQKLHILNPHRKWLSGACAHEVMWLFWLMQSSASWIPPLAYSLIPGLQSCTLMVAPPSTIKASTFGGLYIDLPSSVAFKTLFRVLTVRLRVKVILLFKRSITPESLLSKHFALMLGADLV